MHCLIVSLLHAYIKETFFFSSSIYSWFLFFFASSKDFFLIKFIKCRNGENDPDDRKTFFFSFFFQSIHDIFTFLVFKSPQKLISLTSSLH